MFITNVLLWLLDLDTVIQTDTDTTQYCNFSEAGNILCKFEYNRQKDGDSYQNWG